MGVEKTLLDDFYISSLDYQSLDCREECQREIEMSCFAGFRNVLLWLIGELGR